MSTTGQFNSKSPTIKRILKEASELANQPSKDYHAAPLETDLFEWHFTLCGPPKPSPFDGGLYHGRIILPPAYPLKPPSFRFLTPNGRFEVNREICLSISGHHEETWQPAWGIRTALVAIRSFMDTDAKGQLGGMDASEGVRKRFASQSRKWKCGGCGSKTLEEVVAEQEENVRVAGAETAKEDVVPEELRLAYREDLSKDSGSSTPKSAAEQNGTAPAPAITAPVAAQIVPATPVAPMPQQTPVLQQRQQGQNVTGVPPWVDKAIYGIVAALVILILRKLG